MVIFRQLSLIPIALLGATSAIHAHAAADAGSDAEIEETITVIGTKTERTLNQVGATISVIDEEEMERQITRDIADLVRFEPGVSVSGTGSRFGLSGFNIRGIEGDRVLTIVDGVRISDEFSFGPFLNARRDFVDVDSLEMVEIARGPVSSLYGSDALGGVVSFTTKGPERYVSSDDPFYASIKGGYSSDDASMVGTATVAAGNDVVAGMLTFTHRDGEETESSGSSGGVAAARQEADPQDIEVDNVSAKLVFMPGEAHKFIVSYDRFETDIDTQVLSDYGAVIVSPFGPPVIVNTSDARDERERQKWALEYRYSSVGDNWLDRGVVRVYHQESDNAQLTEDLRTYFDGPRTRFRYSEFEQEIDGFYLQLGSDFKTGGVSHSLTYGVEYYTTDSVSLRDGGSFRLDGTPIPEGLPTRDFPMTEIDHLAYFVQDEIVLMDERLRLTPGLRYDDYDADTEADAIYLAGNPGTVLPEDYDDAELTFAFSAVYQFTDNVSGFARYAEGFRAPPYDDVNIGFTNPGRYKAISNPNLKSETSQGVEFGIRLNSRFGSHNLTVFRNEYEDFIDPRSLVGIDPADFLPVFQSVNRAEVEIEGVELGGYMPLAAFGDALQDFGVRYAIAYADGEDTDLDEPLESINPLTGVVGLQYDAPNRNWGGQLIFTLVEGKDDSDIPVGSSRSQTSGYGIIDLLAYFDFSETVTVNVGLFNLTDKEYTRWADTVAIQGDAPERFTQPGFNAGASIRVVF